MAEIMTGLRGKRGGKKTIIAEERGGDAEDAETKEGKEGKKRGGEERRKKTRFNTECQSTSTNTETKAERKKGRKVECSPLKLDSRIRYDSGLPKSRQHGQETTRRSNPGRKVADRAGRVEERERL